LPIWSIKRGPEGPLLRLNMLIYRVSPLFEALVSRRIHMYFSVLRRFSHLERA